MEELSWLDFDIVPECGDFSFIYNNQIREYLTFDYNLFKKIGFHTIYSKTEIINLIKLSCWYGHTDESFSISINILSKIISYGWTEFVIKYLNGIF